MYEKGDIVIMAQTVYPRIFILTEGTCMFKSVNAMNTIQELYSQTQSMASAYSHKSDSRHNSQVYETGIET